MTAAPQQDHSNTVRVQQQRQAPGCLIERLGGRNTFDLTIIGLAQAIQSDSELQEFYSSYCFDDLIRNQKEFLTSVLLCPDEDEEAERKLKRWILVRHYTLLQQGFNGDHFDVLVILFVQELQDSWVSSIAIQDAVAKLNAVRSVFEPSPMMDNSSSSSSSNSESSLQEASAPGAKCTVDASGTIRRLSSSSSSSSFSSSSTERSSPRGGGGQRRYSSSQEFLLLELVAAKGKENEGKKSSSSNRSLGRQGSSGKFLLNLLRGKGSKRSKKQLQEEEGQ